MVGKLTKAQEAVLAEVAAYKPTAEYPDASYWNTPSYRSLLKRGLIERRDRMATFLGSITFTVHLCRLTDAGRAALTPKGTDDVTRG